MSAWRRSTRLTVAAPLSPGQRRLRRLIRGTALVIAGILGATLAAALTLLALLQHDGFSGWAARRLANAVNPYPGGSITLAGASGTWVTRLELHHLRLVLDGDTAIAFDTLRAAYDPVGFITGSFSFREIHLASPAVRLRQLADSSWDLLRPFAPDTGAAAAERPAPTLAIAALSLTGGRLTARFHAPGRDSSLALEGVELRARDLALGAGAPTLRLDSLSLTAHPPAAPGPVALAARGSLDERRLELRRLELHSPRSRVVGRGILPRPGTAPDDEPVDFTLEATPLAYEDFGPFVPGFDGAGEVRIALAATGTAARPAVRLDAAFPGGGEVAFEGEGTSPRAAPLAYRGALRVRQLDPAQVTGRALDSGRVTGELAFDLTGPRRDSLSGELRLALAQARVRALDGRDVTLLAPLERGRARIALRGTLNDVRLDLRGSMRPLDSVPSFEVAGTLDDVGPYLPAILRDGDASVAARFDLAGAGLEPRTATGRAQIALAPSDTARPTSLRHAAVAARLANGELAGRADVAVDGGEMTLPFTLTVEGRSYRIEGATVRRVDAAQLFGTTISSAIDGSATLVGRGFDPRSLSADLSLELSGPWGGYRSAAVRLTATARRGTVRGQATARLDSASAELRAELRPFAAEPALTIDHIAIERLDLARLAPELLPASSLSGRASVALRGADLGRAASRIGQPAGARATAVALAATLELGDSWLAGVDLERADLALALARDSLRFHGGFEGTHGMARVTGTAHPFEQPIAFRVQEARFERLDLAPVTGPALPTALNGRATLAGRGAQPSQLTLDGLIVLDSSSVRQVALASARATLRADSGHLAVRARVVRPRGAASLEAQGVLPESGARRFDVRLALDDTVLTRSGEPLPTSLALVATAVDVAPSEARRPLSAVVSIKGRAGEAALDSAHAIVRAAKGMLTIDTLFVASRVARMAGAGRVVLGADASNGTSDLRLRARLGDVAPLAPALGARLLGLDSARLDVRLTGHGDSLAFDVTADGRAFVYEDYRLGVLAATARGWIRGDRRLARLEGSLEAGRARVGFVDARSLQTQASWNGAEWSAQGALVIDDRRQVTGAGRLDPRGRRVFLETLAVATDGEPWTLRQPVEARYGDTLAVRDFALSSSRGMITVDGALDGSEDARLRVALRGISLGSWSDLFGYPELAGELEGSIDVTGAARAPRAMGQLTAELRTRRAVAGTVLSRFDWAGRQLALDVTLTDRAGGRVTLAGTVPRALPFFPAPRDGAASDPVDLRLVTESGGLWLAVVEPFLDPRAATDLTGRIVADARMRGTVERPVLSGTLALRDGRVRLPTLGVTYDSIAGRAVLAGDRVRLEDVRIGSGRGTLAMTGSLTAGRAAGWPFDFAVRLADFPAVETTTYQAILRGDVRFHGTLAAPALDGTVAVRDAHVNLATAQATANVERVELTPADLRTLEQRFGYGRSGVRSPLDGLYDALALDLIVDLERNTWLRHPQNPQVVLELVGRVRVRKAPRGDLLADGTIELLPGRSYVEQFGARFEVRSGEVLLAGRPEALQLSVKTRHEAGTRQSRRDGRVEPAVVITMDVEGTPEEIRLTLASEPELTDTEIISYLATGRLPNWTPGASQGERNVAAGVALRQVSRSVQGALGETLPLDVVEVRSDGLRGLTLVAGRYTSPQLYLGVKQPISFSTDEHSSTAASKATEFEVEYEAYRWLLVNLQGGASALRFFLKARRAY